MDRRRAAVAVLTPVNAGLPGARSALRVRRDWSEKKNPSAAPKSHTRHFLCSLPEAERPPRGAGRAHALVGGKPQPSPTRCQRLAGRPAPPPPAPRRAQPGPDPQRPVGADPLRVRPAPGPLLRARPPPARASPAPPPQTPSRPMSPPTKRSGKHRALGLIVLHIFSTLAPSRIELPSRAVGIFETVT